MPMNPPSHKAIPQAARVPTPDDRPSPSKRGYGRRWRRLRLMKLRRDPLCAKCGGPATEVHHVQAKRDGGSDALDNLQSLCKPCHSAITMRECWVG